MELTSAAVAFWIVDPTYALWSSLGLVLVGVGLGWLAGRGRDWELRNALEDTAAYADRLRRDPEFWERERARGEVG